MKVPGVPYQPRYTSDELVLGVVVAIALHVLAVGPFIVKALWPSATAHEDDQDCMALLQIVDGKFKPVYGKKGKPFLCFADDLAKIPKNPELK